jgi:hypothetical protein
MKGLDMNDLKLHDFCLIIDNFLPDTICDNIITLFENNSNYHQRFDNNKTPNFTQLNFTQHNSLDTKLHIELTKYMIEAVKAYIKHVPETSFWSPGFSYEQLRIKKYDNNNIDQFDSHIDAANSDTCKRFLAFFWYLNDVTKGGETEFLNIDVKVQPKKGKLVMFPPTWMYPHKGYSPISNKKYLLSSYLHFS